MSSDEGLNAYGAVTWGQFFIYQGFNEKAGWMHTSSGVDNVDEFAETMTQAPMAALVSLWKRIAPRHVADDDALVSNRRRIIGPARVRDLRTHHGPIVREEGGKWIAFALMNRPVAALQQSFLRTKVNDYASFLKVAAIPGQLLE